MRSQSLFILFCLHILIYVCTPAHAQSGTLPVLHIDTKDGAEIKSKTVYVDGTYWLEPAGEPASADIDNTPFGSDLAPLPIQIRGRGNSSWRGEKKQYKIRLGDKAPLLGMNPNRHWALLPGASWPTTFAGFQLGNIMGMEWNPSCRLVEVVLNDEYWGLYTLTETIRIGKNRLNIYEQDDENEDPETLPGGWLVEVDNYVESNQISIREKSTTWLRVTYHSPDKLSKLQSDWLNKQFKTMNDLIYGAKDDIGPLAGLLDIDAMARYFIVQEVMDNPDGFHGSFYLHKDLGEDALWTAGPLWDVACLNRQKTDYTFRMKASYNFVPHWIGELLKFDEFCYSVRDQWELFYPEHAGEWLDYIDRQSLPYFAADSANNARWPKADYPGIEAKTAQLKKSLLSNMEWFDKHLPGHPRPDKTGIHDILADTDGFGNNNAFGNSDTFGNNDASASGRSTYNTSKTVTVYNLQGIKVSEARTLQQALQQLPPGTYISNGKKITIR